MSALALRAATVADSAFAYGVRRAVFREYLEQAGGWEETEQLRLHAQRFATQEYQIISAAGQDVGVTVWVVTPDCLKVNQLFLLPEHQGRGLGRQVMAHIMAQARELELPVRLHVLKANPRAFAFYRRLGFVCTGETATHDLMEWLADGRSEG